MKIAKIFPSCFSILHWHTDLYICIICNVLFVRLLRGGDAASQSGKDSAATNFSSAMLLGICAIIFIIIGNVLHFLLLHIWFRITWCHSALPMPILCKQWNELMKRVDSAESSGHTVFPIANKIYIIYNIKFIIHLMSNGEFHRWKQHPCYPLAASHSNEAALATASIIRTYKSILFVYRKHFCYLLCCWNRFDMCWLTHSINFCSLFGIRLKLTLVSASSFPISSAIGLFRRIVHQRHRLQH